MKNVKKITIKIILAILLVVCLFQMPYGYFQFIRFLGMITFIWFAYVDSKDNKMLIIIWIASAFLINPFFKIALGRTVWNIMDIVWAIILIISIRIDNNNK